MKLLGIALAAALGVFVFTGSEAQAQSCRNGGYGGYGGGYGNGLYFNTGSFGIGIGSGYNSGYYGGGYNRGYYHDTSHYDYHPTSLQRHRNHYHVVPGHYDYHRTGHWHR